MQLKNQLLQQDYSLVPLLQVFYQIEKQIFGLRVLALMTKQGYNLVVKADFLIAKGLLDFMDRPFFHFQEYKPQKQPTGDPMAQLLEAFLIGQVKNDDGKPLYGCEVNGYNWRFITMEGKDYCVSKPYIAMIKEDLLQIIAILRKFREILETRLLA